VCASSAAIIGDIERLAVGAREAALVGGSAVRVALEAGDRVASRRDGIDGLAVATDREILYVV
jgi:hypothetical protein